MKEYKVQMKLKNGKWCRGRYPHNPVRKTFKTIKEAYDYMNSYSEAWKVYIEKCEKIGIRLVDESLPEEWRIMSREVSEWKSEEL